MKEQKTGLNSLRIINNPNIASQPFPVMGAFRVLDNPLDKTNFSLAYSISIDSYPGGNSSIFALECGSIVDNALVLEIYFSYDGSIKILENNGTDFTVTNVGTWNRNTWYDVRVTGEGNDIRYYLNGTLVHTGQLLYNIDEIRFAHDNYSGAAFIDDVNINYDALSVQDNVQNTWTIHPNPVKDILNLKGLTNLESYAVYDISGRKLEEAFHNTKQIDLSHLNTGVYLLQLKTDKGQVTKKFIKN
ncbi:T9SS type A sorting domain-containing protein [Oceanihabitans sediminis]|uniref:T9SS C-terminal target domain-containing protein n=1 Tax=Oceanihabitans sediminis TaxID=1812012 RepID=A0A368P3N3_9FLAO|nr:T9SS type A sorting domain-containing protein [Oceanihabitans sediminis]MDX1279211.1 T9SS type A sorting domain-containing protein [Oceanihabitans sediminis]MDX1774642.1 T9SS type A sorting domain-containing protein [Oceanihabitans sediminis]RBP28477.1 putative secreted protein (Por secretion system target) [Oceanihabitans sediminis]RCU56674.1 T9SS C-terminal target domain-containing protein [Oceanihabitans sediminis]